MKITITSLQRKDDLKQLATEYAVWYNHSVLQENWTTETAYQLLEYYYNLVPELFLVAYDNKKPVGAIMSLVKPWWDGMHIEDTECFVATAYQKLKIGTNLFKKHFQLALTLYNATIIETHTYENEDGFPLKWYNHQGYTTVDDWKIIRGDISKILEKLTKGEK